MFTIVDAVNQQIPANITPAAMLVLTKFAELVTSAKEPLQCRVSVERFMATTHYKSRKQVTNILDDLERKGYLKPLEDRKKKKPGDKATLYELCLPEGYDENIIKKRRCRYYGGKSFYSPFNESMEDLSWWEQDLTAKETPVTTPGTTQSTTQSTSSGAEDFYAEWEKFMGCKYPNTSPTAETDPKKNQIKLNNSKTHNNRENVVVDSESVRKAKEDAAETTGASPEDFDGCGITDENADLMFEAIDEYIDLEDKVDIKHPVNYLTGIFKNLCEADEEERERPEDEF